MQLILLKLLIFNIIKWASNKINYIKYIYVYKQSPEVMVNFGVPVEDSGYDCKGSVLHAAVVSFMFCFFLYFFDYSEKENKNKSTMLVNMLD